LVSVTANSWQDSNGQSRSRRQHPSLTVDTKPAGVTVKTSSMDVNLANKTVTITFAFSEAPVSFSLAPPPRSAER
jgi:hypothetical protein